MPQSLRLNDLTAAGQPELRSSAGTLQHFPGRAMRVERSDRAKAQTRVERMVCGDRAIAELDEYPGRYSAASWAEIGQPATDLTAPRSLERFDTPEGTLDHSVGRLRTSAAWSPRWSGCQSTHEW